MFWSMCAQRPASKMASFIGMTPELWFRNYVNQNVLPVWYRCLIFTFLQTVFFVSKGILGILQ